MEKYNSFSIESMKKAYELGKNLAAEGEEQSNLSEILVYRLNWNIIDLDHLAAFVYAGFYGEKVDFEPKTWYRIGEPKIDYYGNHYQPSRNYADDRQEAGVSVVTTEWLHSMKSVFFGAHDDDNLKTRGIYKIRGIQISTGGDDEPVIYPIDWAEKTRIRSFSGLEKAVKVQIHC